MAVFGLFSAVFRTIVLKVMDDRRHAEQVFPMRAVDFSWRLGYQRLQMGVQSGMYHTIMPHCGPF